METWKQNFQFKMNNFIDKPETLVFSFYNGKHIQFNLREYPLIELEWIERHTFERIFNVVRIGSLEKYLLLFHKQMEILLSNYIKPPSIYNLKFEDRLTLKIYNREYIVNPKDEHHSLIIMLDGIINCLEESFNTKHDFYVMPRSKVINKLHIPIIYRIKYFIHSNQCSVNELKSFIATEFENDSIPTSFIDIIINDLVELHIVNVDGIKLSKGNYFDFFY
jgi:hypothetical protein